MSRCITAWTSVKQTAIAHYEAELSAVQHDCTSSDQQLQYGINSDLPPTSEQNAELIVSLFNQYKYTSTTPLVVVIETLDALFATVSQRFNSKDSQHNKIRSIEKLYGQSRMTPVAKNGAEVRAYSLLKRWWEQYRLNLATLAREYFMSQNGLNEDFEESFFASINMQNMLTNPVWMKHFMQLNARSDLAYSTLGQIRDLLVEYETLRGMSTHTNVDETKLPGLASRVLNVQQRETQVQHAKATLDHVNRIVQCVSTYIRQTQAQRYTQRELSDRKKKLHRNVTEPLSKLKEMLHSRVQLSLEDAGHLVGTIDTKVEAEAIKQLQELHQTVLLSTNRSANRGALARALAECKQAMNSRELEAYQPNGDRYNEFVSALKDYTTRSYNSSWQQQVSDVLNRLHMDLSAMVEFADAYFGSSVFVPGHDTDGQMQAVLFECIRDVAESTKADVMEAKRASQSDAQTRTYHDRFLRLKAKWFRVAVNVDSATFLSYLLEQLSQRMHNASASLTDVEYQAQIVDIVEEYIKRVQEHGVPKNYTPEWNRIDELQARVKRDINTSELQSRQVKPFLQELESCIGSIHEQAVGVETSMEQSIFEPIDFRWSMVSDEGIVANARVTQQHINSLSSVLSEINQVVEATPEQIPTCIRIDLRVYLARATEFLQQCKNHEGATVELKKAWERINEVWFIEHLLSLVQ